MSGPPRAAGSNGGQAGGDCCVKNQYQCLATTVGSVQHPHCNGVATARSNSVLPTTVAAATWIGGGGGGCGAGGGGGPGGGAGAGVYSSSKTPASWLRVHLYKLLLVLVVALLLLQYAFSSIFEAHQLEPLFTINASAGAVAGLPGVARHPGSSTANIFSASATAWDETLPPASTGGAANASGAPSDAATALQPLDHPASITTLQPSDGQQLCPLVPPGLDGPFCVTVDSSVPPLEQLGPRFPQLEVGGAWRPESCTSRSRVAVIVPYRDRERHLSVLLFNLHPFLQRQQLDYRIVIVEQAGSTPFNRAMLMNIGFVESLKLYDFECFIFHDVDLLPEDDRNLYTCPEQPRHMSVAVDVLRYRLPYNDIFGGVSAMSKEQFQKVNGFSNMFWGWGGEDDDMANRLKYRGFHISRYPANIARYKMLSHRKQRANPKRYEMLYTGRKRFKTDGLSSLRYVRKELNLYHTYTRVLVELVSPS